MKVNFKEWKKLSIQIECKHKQMNRTAYRIDNHREEGNNWNS